MPSNPVENVWRDGTWYGPDYPENGEMPDIDEDGDVIDDELPEPPPKKGTGSGRDAWVAYAEAHGAQVGKDASREDIIAGLQQAGIPTE